MYGRAESRQLPGHACEECRRKKLRCDRVVPQCGGCRKAGRICKSTTRGSTYRSADIVIPDKFSQLHEADSVHTVSTASVDGAARDAANHPTNPNGSSSSARHTSTLRSPRLPSLASGSCGDMTAVELLTPAASSVAGHETDVSSSPTTGTLVLPPAPLHATEATQSSPGHLSDLVKSDLVQLFLDRVHPNIPIVSRPKLQEAAGGVNQTTKCRECLYDTIYTFAAGFSTQFSNIEEALYGRSRSALERLEAPGNDSEICQIEHIQSWTLITFYEFARCSYRRAWLSAGRVFRLAQLANLSDLENPARVAPQGSGADDAADLEEKRRTFWAVYCLDKLIGLSGDGPTTFDEHSISTRLPSLDVDLDWFVFPEVSLSEALCSADLRAYSSLAECSILLTIWARMCSTDSRSPGICARYDWIESLLARRLTNLQARIPGAAAGAPTLESVDVFLYMLAQSITVVLCNCIEALPSHEQSHGMLCRFQERATWAAQEIARLAKEQQHAGLFKAHPFMPLTIYLGAARLAKHIDPQEDGVEIQVEGGIEASWRMAHQSLQKLMSVNRLADHYLQLL